MWITPNPQKRSLNEWPFSFHYSLRKSGKGSGIILLSDTVQKLRGLFKHSILSTNKIVQLPSIFQIKEDFCNAETL